MKTRVCGEVDRMRQLIVHEVLADAAYQHAAAGIISGTQHFTYPEIYVRSLKLAHRMTELGVGPGTVVGVMDINSHRYLELKYAVSMTGAVIHTINFRLPTADMAYTIRHSHDDWLFVWTGFGELATSMATLVSEVVWLGDSDGFSGRHYEELIAEGSPVVPNQALRVKEDDTYSLFYTTATTGHPKGIRYSHRQMLSASLQIAHYLGLHDTGAVLRAHDVMMPLIPFFHIHGWGVPFVAPYLGSTLVLPEKSSPAEQWQLIQSHQVTWCNMVPTQLFMLLQERPQEVRAAPPLKVLTGGSALSIGLAEQALSAGISLSLIYGGSDQLGSAISEAAGLEGSERLVRLSTRMTPFPMVRVEIRDEKGQLVASDGEAIGEVWVQSPWIPREYVEEPEQSEQAFHDGWFRTGDLAVRYPDGSFYVMDRLKDAIKSGGEWIAGSVIESIVSEVSGVQAVAVIAQVDAQWGERPVAVVQGEKDISVEGILEHLRHSVAEGRLPKFWMPEGIYIIDTMPTTSAGKLHKAALRQEGVVPHF
ncbi:MAG: AMP-binding protein [Ferrimicrobium sp.]